MNKNQKFFGGVLVIVVVIGLCIFFYNKGKKDQKRSTNGSNKGIKKNSKRIDELERVVSEAIKENPDTDITSTIEQLARERKDLFEEQQFRVIKANPKKGAEDTLRAFLEKEKHPSPEAVSDLIEEPIESLLANEEEMDNEITKPSQDSDQVISPEETNEREVASEEEMKRRLVSALGPKELENDLWKFHSKNSKGEYILEYKETKELVSNICYHYPGKSTGRVFETKHERAYTLPYLMFQIYDRHKLNKNEAHKFAQVLVDNISYYKGKTAESIVSNWNKIGKGKLRSELVANPHIVLI